MPTLQKMPSIAAGPSRHVYDVIVLGGQLGGALAAALLAKRGYRVLLLDHDGMGPGYEHGGYLLPYAPFIAPALKSMPAVEEAFNELALTTTAQRALRSHSPDLQLILPRHRIDLHREPSATAGELRREFGEAGAGIAAGIEALAAYHEQSDAFFKEPMELPPDSFMERWKLGGWIKKNPGLQAPLPGAAGEGIGELLGGLLPFVSHLSGPTRPLALGRPLSQALRAPGRYVGGREGLRDFLLKKLADLGGVVLGRDGASENLVAEHFAFEGGKLVGLKLLQSENVYRGGCVVAATDSGALRRLVEDKKRHRGLLEQLDQSTVRHFVFPVNWVLPADALPRGMGEQLLMQADEEFGAVLLQVLPARRVGKPDDEAKRVVCAGAVVPASARDLGEAHLQSLVERLGERLEILMPFARERVALVSAPYLDAGGVRGSRLLPHPLFSIDTEQQLGVEGLKQRTPIRNLILANREVLPGLGLEGELLAGIRAARLVQETLPKRSPLGR